MKSLTIIMVIFIAGCSRVERSLLFYPTHLPGDGGLARWTKDGKLIGFSRETGSPRNVWLVLHGNGGQAADRAYALPRFSAEDSVYILEYPGYGEREGIPSRQAFNQAAEEAYRLLRSVYPKTPVCVVGESIGSGPGSFLAGLDHPPDKLVLVVPFERLSLVAQDHFPAVLVRLLLTSNWDNLAALANYKGTVDIFGAKADTVIPVRHAQALAAGVPSARFILIDGGHNDWARQERVMIRNP